MKLVKKDVLVGRVKLGEIERLALHSFQPISGFLPVDFFKPVSTYKAAEQVLLAAYAVVVGSSLIKNGGNPDVERAIAYWGLRGGKPD